MWHSHWLIPQAFTEWFAKEDDVTPSCGRRPVGEDPGLAPFSELVTEWKVGAPRLGWFPKTQVTLLYWSFCEFHASLWTVLIGDQRDASRDWSKGVIPFPHEARPLLSCTQTQRLAASGVLEKQLSDLSPTYGFLDSEKFSVLNHACVIQNLVFADSQDSLPLFCVIEIESR